VSIIHMPKLLLIDNGKAQEIQMGQELTIGRAYSNLLRLEGEEISRVHVIMYRRGDDYVLRDLDSKNGVMLNGQKVLNALLGQGDQIQVGNYLLVFDPPSSIKMEEILSVHGAALESEVHTTGPNELDTSLVFNPKDAAKLGMAQRNGKNLLSVPESEPEVCFEFSYIAKLGEEQLAEPSMEISRAFIHLQQEAANEAERDAQDTAQRSTLFRLLAPLVRSLNADRGVVIFKDESDGGLLLGAIYPGDKDVAVNRVVLRSVLRENKLVLCNDALNDSRFSITETVKKDKIGSLIACPLIRQGEVMGLIYLDAIERTGVFRPEHLLVVDLATRLAALVSESHLVGKK